MNVDEMGAIGMFVAENRTFIDQNTHEWLVIHKTASGGSAQDIANFFANDPAMASTHYVVGQDGTVVQCVLEKDGAGGNCCLETGHAAYLPPGVNLNVRTVSIEHVDPASDNSTPLTDAQKAASFRLVRDICIRHNIPMRPGDASGGIIGHMDIAPLSRARCPGNYPWAELFAYLQGGSMIPLGWKDDGQTLTAPNGVGVVLGFRVYVLSHAWDPGNVPLAPEQGVSLLEASNPGLGGGNQQVFRWSMLGYTTARGVFMEWIGQELIVVRQQAITYHDLSKTLQAEVDSLKQQLATAQQPAGVDPAHVASYQAQVALLSKQIEQLAQQLQQGAAQPLS